MRNTDNRFSRSHDLERIPPHLELGVLIRLVRSDILGEAPDVLDGLVKLFLYGQCHGWGSEVLVVVGGQLG